MRILFAFFFILFAFLKATLPVVEAVVDTVKAGLVERDEVVATIGGARVTTGSDPRRHDHKNHNQLVQFYKYFNKYPLLDKG